MKKIAFIILLMSGNLFSQSTVILPDTIFIAPGGWEALGYSEKDSVLTLYAFKDSCLVVRQTNLLHFRKVNSLDFVIDSVVIREIKNEKPAFTNEQLQKVIVLFVFFIAVLLSIKEAYQWTKK